MWSKPFFLALVTFAVQLGLNLLLAALRDWLNFSSFNSFSFSMYFGVHLLAAAAAGCFYATKQKQEPDHKLKLKAAVYYGLIWAALIGFTLLSNDRLLNSTNRWANLVALVPISALFGFLMYIAVGAAAHVYFKTQKRLL